MANNPTDSEKDLKTYEVAYLLTPFLPLDKVEETIEAAYQAWITDLGGLTIVKHAPKMRTLAYPVAKFINNKKSSFTEAYFGAVKFQLSPDALRTTKEILEKDGNIIRFLITVVPKNADRVFVPRGIKRERVKTAAEPEKAEKGEEMSSEQIDKEIEGLLETPAA